LGGLCGTAWPTLKTIFPPGGLKRAHCKKNPGGLAAGRGGCEVKKQVLYEIVKKPCRKVNYLLLLVFLDQFLNLPFCLDISRLIDLIVIRAEDEN
jgi:hypothetical protein